MHITIIIFFLISNFILLIEPSKSSNLIVTNKLDSTGNTSSKYSINNSNSSDFVNNTPILKSYGPLILDINNINYASGIFIIPMLNNDNKPLFLAVNCNDSHFNIISFIKWKDWYSPFFTYEFNILNDICSE